VIDASILRERDFRVTHRHRSDTKDPAHLATAKRLADFFVGRLADGFPDHVPNFDLTYGGLGPLSNLTHRDASAAAIAASVRRSSFHLSGFPTILEDMIALFGTGAHRVGDVHD